jgi:hypothetical protein
VRTHTDPESCMRRQVLTLDSFKEEILSPVTGISEGRNLYTYRGQTIGRPGKGAERSLRKNGRGG